MFLIKVLWVLTAWFAVCIQYSYEKEIFDIDKEILNQCLVRTQSDSPDAGFGKNNHEHMSTKEVVTWNKLPPAKLLAHPAKLKDLYKVLLEKVVAQLGWLFGIMNAVERGLLITLFKTLKVLHFDKTKLLFFV